MIFEASGTAPYGDDPVQDSQEIRRQSLVPIVRRLQNVLHELEEYVGEAEYDDDGRRGD